MVDVHVLTLRLGKAKTIEDYDNKEKENFVKD
jgi:hypothetical protein